MEVVPVECPACGHFPVLQRDGHKECGECGHRFDRDAGEAGSFR